MSSDAFDKAARLTISPDALRATIQFQPGFDPCLVTPEVVEEFLVARGIVPSSITPAGANDLATQLAEDPETAAEAVVAEGVAPVHGEDGRFDLDPRLVPRKPEKPLEGEDKAFDHYGRSAFIIVEKGQHLGVLRPLTECKDGANVRGEAIKASEGRSCPLAFDDTVKLQDDGSVISLENGRLEITSARIGVDPVLEIAESVDFSTGNIRFPGDVVIRKGVRDRFIVEVGGNLEIVELVEAATIEARGSVVLLRGMAGRGKGELSVGGGLEAKYLDGANVDVKYDLRVQRELTNCVTHVGRCVRSPTCTVVGGELWARFGGEVRSLGGEAEAETLVRIGVDAEMDACARMLEELLPQATGRVSRAMQELADLKQAAGKPSPSQASTIASLQFEVMTEQARFPAIRSAIERVLGAYQKLQDATLAVERSILPGVTLSIGSQAATVREPIRGPVVVARDSSGALVLRDPGSGSNTPLAAKAKLHPAPGSADLDELRRWLDNPMLALVAKAA